jgi:cellulose biosynthesis protein BcsQ
MKLLPAANMKGGVGKTTLIVSLADGLAYVYGFKVLVIDLDMQCNASQVVWGADEPLPWRGQENVAGFLRRWRSNSQYDPKLDIKANVICHKRPSANAGWVSLFSGSNQLRMLERRWLSETGSYETCVSTVQRAVDWILDRAAGAYDVILVDCPPGISMLTEAVLARADMLLVPTAPTRFGIEGLNSYIDFVCDVAPGKRPKVFLSMLDGTNVTADFVQMIREAAAKPGCRFGLLDPSYQQLVAFENAMGCQPNTPFPSKYGNVAESVKAAARTVATELRIAPI